jgi:myo-inositol-1(or 4)-monophosphatase
MNSLTARELDDIYTFAIDLGKSAGKILLEAAQQRYGDNAVRDEQHVEKLNAVDLVTKTDEGTLVQLE